MNDYLLQCSYVLLPHTHEPTNISLVALLITAVAFAFYSLAVYVQWQNNKKWNPWRFASFVTGCIITVMALSSPMVNYAHHDFKVHMLQHLLLAMLAPIALVLGTPVWLALRVLPRKRAKQLSQILNNKLFHFISHPVTALVLNTGGMYVLYLTPLYNSMHNNPLLQYLVHFHFLAAGYLFTWAMIGPDPAPRKPKLVTRIVVLFISIAAHAYLSKFMFAYLYPRSAMHTEKELQAGAQIMYYGGDIIELMLVIALFTIWYLKKGKPYYRLSV